MDTLIRFLVVLNCVFGGSALASAQNISFAEQRPFVVGVVPVVGNGAVGGVAVDASGVVALAEQRDLLELKEARRVAMVGLAGDAAKQSRLRKISLRRLDALLAQHASENIPLPPEVLYLAGLQRVEYVFAYPETHDVVLAGPAEAWTVDEGGNAVGEDSGAAVLQLVDLIAALRTIDKLIAGEMISCSIDPTPAGLQQFAALLRRSRTSPSTQLLRRMEQAVGPQTITLTGIAPESHFAQVLVVADWQMKRLGMGLAASPVDGLTSYLEMLKDKPGMAPRNTMPRWWLAYGDEPVERDAEGLSWSLSRPGVQVCTAAGRLQPDGDVDAQTASDPLAKAWAASMTKQYDRLAVVEPIFGQLRGCMDLGLVAAIVAAGDLLTAVNLELPMLLDDARLQLASHHVPRTVASQASAIKGRREWIVSISGGVELDVARLINAANVRTEIREVRTEASPSPAASWWWD